MISRVCEEFSCLPAEAIHALEHDHNGLIFVILDMRNYAESKGVLDDYHANGSKGDPPRGKNVDRVREIMAENMKDDHEKRKLK